MSLRSIPYTSSSGEWFPYNGGNYTTRSNAMFFFHSLNNKTDLFTNNISFLDSVNLQSTSTDTMSDTWPLNEDATIASGTVLQKPTYVVSYANATNIMTILINGPYEESVYTTINAPAGTLQADQEIYDTYVADVQKILSFNKKSGSYDDINQNFQSFEWGIITASNSEEVDCSGIISIPEFLSATETNEIGISNRMYEVKIRLSNSDDFPAALYSGVPVWQTSSNISEVVEWNPQLVPTDLTGDIIKIDSPAAQNIQSNSYILLTNTNDTNLGRYFVKGVYPIDGVSWAVDVDRIDGSQFILGNHPSVTVSDISVRPRLRIKYRLKDDPSTGIFYKFFSVPDAANDPPYSRLNPLGTKAIENKLECDTPAFISASNQLLEVGGSIELDMAGAPNLTPLTFGLNTTLEDDGNGLKIRKTPWRKAYRFMSRFRPKSVDIHQVKTITPNPYDGVVRFKTYQGTARSKPTSVNANHQYPLAISHRPPCMQHQNPGDLEQKGFGTILVDYDFDNGTLLEGTYRQDETTGAYLFAGNGDHYIERDREGFKFEENGLPNAMIFTANLNDVFDDGNYNYDYTGLISCARTVVPAYSGEILYFDTNHGFVKNNYTNPDIGITNKTAVFVDITETDEVLRWNGNNYSNPHEFWRATFTSMTLKNKTSNELATFTDYVVLKTEKDNYVVVMYRDETVNIQDGDLIEIAFRNKKTLTNWQDTSIIPDPISSPTAYSPINYRNIGEEWVDDHRLEYTDPVLRDFTISSDGTVDGTITINYDGDVPEGTEFRLYIQDDETTP